MKLADGMVDQVDELVRDGRFENRTAVVRAALDRMLAEIREQQIDAAIIEGYRRIPPGQPDEKWLDAWAEAATRAMIEEEPWP